MMIVKNINKTNPFYLTSQCPPLVLFFTILLSLNSENSYSQKTIYQDPFLPYLSGKTPEITRDLGTETIDGIKVHRLVFLSRTIETSSGPVPTTVYAAIAFPVGPGKHAALLRLHGGGGAADIPAAVSSAKEGYVSLVLDIPGVTGKSVKNDATNGAWITREKITANPDPTYSALFDAVVASIDAFYLLKSQPEVDPNKISIAGASWGGYVATMLAGLLDKDIAATWSVFGSGNFLKGAFEKQNIEKLPAAEKEMWLKYLDPGLRAGKITKPYFINTASNDRHWSWMAVQATIADMKGPTNQFFSPNENHKVSYPGTGKMIEFLNHYVRKTGPPLPLVFIEKAKKMKDGSISVSVKASQIHNITEAKIYYSIANPDWTEREWKEVGILTKNGKMEAVIPAINPSSGIDFYAIITDQDMAWRTEKCSVSSLIRHSK